MGRLPQAFGPLVGGVTRFDSKVERIAWDPVAEKLQLQWRPNYTERAWEHDHVDYAVVAVPFSVVSRWRLPSASPKTGGGPARQAN